MIVRRIHVRKFRKLLDQVLECGPGLNVIRGRNDAGKSTLHRAFCAALFPVRPKEADTFGPWGEDRPGEIVLEFEEDGRSYRLRKDFRTRKTTLEVDGRVLEGKAVEAEVGRILGLTSLKLFRATVHIGQWELAAVQEEREEIGTRLAQIVSGTDRDALRVLRDLEGALRKMEVGLRGRAATPGPLKQAADEIARLTAERDRLAQEVDAVERAAAERDRVAAQCAALERQVAEEEALLEANRSLLELNRRCEELERRASELRELLDRIDAAQREVDMASRDDALRIPLPDEGVVTALRDAQLRVERLRGELNAAEEALASPRESARPGGTVLDGRWVAVLVGVAASCALASAALLLSGRGEWGLALLGSAVTAAVLALSLRGALRAQAVHQERLHREEEAAREAVEARRRDVEDAEGTIASLLRGAGARSVEDLEERIAAARGARERLERARALLDGLLGGRTREAITQAYQEVALELTAVRAQRDAPDLALRRLEPSQFHHLQQEVARHRSELDAAREKLRRLDFQLSGRAPQEDLARVEELLEAAHARYARLHRHAAVLRLTREVLDLAHRDTIVPGKAQLERLAGQYLRALTHGTYDRIQVDDQSLAPRVWVGPPKEWADVTAREIGSGAVDQCYLALRLALVDLLCPDRRPPLFLDDPFLAYDEDRQASALQLLRELAQERQIFLFTCRRAYDGYADTLIVLDEGAELSGPGPVPLRR